MPVEAAIEGRVQFPRRFQEGLVPEHLSELVRIFLGNARRRQRSESRRFLRRQRVLGSGFIVCATGSQPEQDEDGNEDPEAYLDEEEQTEISVLQWVLDG